MGTLGHIFLLRRCQEALAPAMDPESPRVQPAPIDVLRRVSNENANHRWPATTRRIARRMPDRRIRRGPEACEQHDRPGVPCENNETSEAGGSRRDQARAPRREAVERADA